MRYLPLRSYDNYITANLERSLLQEAGILCHLKDEYTVTIDPLLSPALGGMKLMVEEATFNRAKEILDESDQHYLQSIPCSTCKEPALELITTITEYSSWSGKLKSLLINGEDHKTRKFYRCNNCFSEFDELVNE